MWGGGERGKGGEGRGGRGGEDGRKCKMYKDRSGDRECSNQLHCFCREHWFGWSLESEERLRVPVKTQLLSVVVAFPG